MNPCIPCLLQQYKKAQYYAHMKFQHVKTNKSLCVCPKCAAACATPSTMQAHLRHVHADDEAEGDPDQISSDED
jgi:hypothetical protein